MRGWRGPRQCRGCCRRQSCSWGFSRRRRSPPPGRATGQGASWSSSWRSRSSGSGRRPSTEPGEEEGLALFYCLRLIEPPDRRGYSCHTCKSTGNTNLGWKLSYFGSSCLLNNMQLTVSYGAALSIGIYSSGANILAANFDLSNYSWLFQGKWIQVLKTRPSQVGSK